MPTTCPFRVDDNKPCKLVTDHDRYRKTGPCFSLRVLRCITHKKSFTLYPPGHFPYGRKPLIQVGVDGKKVVDLEYGDQRFQSTLFDAALDADNNKPWNHGDVLKSFMRPFSTQVYHLHRATCILGLEDAISDNQRHAISQVLMLPVITLSEGAVCIKNNSGYQNTGKVICSLLDKLPKVTSIFERLVEVGSQAGLWPPPFFLDPYSNRLRESAFQQFRIRAPPT